MDTLPPSIRSLLPETDYTLDQIGRSHSQIFLFPDRVLKIQPLGTIQRNEAAMLSWLEDKLNVPRVLACEEMGEVQYLLLSRLIEPMACDQVWLERPHALVEALAGALNTFWGADPAGCPSVITLEEKLAQARQNVEAGDIDPDPATFGPGGFPSPEALLRWLEDNRPDQGAGVLTHGDFCLPNIFLSPTGRPGYIDLGLAGIGDPWRDIALCRRSLAGNLSGGYGGPAYPGDPDELFSALGLARDGERMEYYLLLDELF